MASVQGFNFRGLEGSKAPSGLNPGTRLAAFPGDGEPRLGWERSPGLRGLRGRVAVWGFRITANHYGIKMFTGRGGISSELMIFNVIIFCPVSRARSVWSLVVLGDGDTVGGEEVS